MEIKAITERVKVLPERESLLRRQAVIRMAHTSTSIEGNPLAEFEVEKVLAGQKIEATKRVILEVQNYEKALLRVIQLAARKIKITKQIILFLHQLLMTNLVDKEKAGYFRKNQVYIVNEYKDHEELAYQPPEAKFVVPLINDLLGWLNNEVSNLHPIIISGLLHYQFVTIHPFTDGNGRLTRLLTQYHLYLKSYDFRKVLVLEEYYNQNRKAYYEALQTGKDYKERDGVDLTNWLEYFTTGFLAEAENTKSKIEQLGFGVKINDGEQIYLDRDEIKIMDFVNTTGRLTSQDVVEILNIGKRAAQLKLEKLLVKKIVQKKGKGPATFYLLNNGN